MVGQSAEKTTTLNNIECISSSVTEYVTILNLFSIVK